MSQAAQALANDEGIGIVILLVGLLIFGIIHWYKGRRKRLIYSQED